MQSLEINENPSSLPSSNMLPQHSSKASMNGDMAAFARGPFHTNRASIGGLRDRQGATMPAAINTARNSQTIQNADMQTPGTAYNMNFTPLLPSELLLGSPFQPGSPATFGQSQFQSFSTLSQPNGPQQQNQQSHMASAVQGQQPLSPQMYQNMMAPGMGGPQYYGAPNIQSPTFGNMGHNMMGPMQVSPSLAHGTSRTVYLGNIPPDTSAEEILGHVRSGQIESVRLLPDKNCAFISFLDSSSAVHFHSDAILKKLSIRGQDIKIGWGKPSQVPSSVALAVQQSSASRNVYLGNLPPDIAEEEIREDLSKFGAIDTIKLVREKSIGFVHFLSISSAIKAVTQLPQEPKWQPPRRVFYGKDRCAYVSKTQQQNAAQYLGIPPAYAANLNSADRDLMAGHLAQQSVAAAAVATAAGGASNLGNRTVYLGNIHPETTTEEICNVVRGGLLHHIRYIPDKHICFVTFIDPTAAASFYALSNMQGLMIHNRRLKIGWGKHSGPLPPAIAMAVSGGASRNVYIGNIDDSWTEERLRQDFSEYGEIELVNTLREKSCAFVNFTNIANAIKAIEAVRGKDEYKRFKVNFGKDRCGNPPRQIQHNHQDQYQQAAMQMGQDGVASPQLNGNLQAARSSQGGSAVSPAGSGISRPPGSNSGHMPNGSVHQPSSSNSPANPLTMYLNHINTQGPQQQGYDQGSPGYSSQQPHINGYGGQQSQYFDQTMGQGSMSNRAGGSGQYASHSSSNSFSVNNSNLNQANGPTTIGGLLAPSNLNRQHARAISLPAFSQYVQQPQQQGASNSGYDSLGTGLGPSMSNGTGQSNYGLAIQGDSGLPRWAEEEVTS